MAQHTLSHFYPTYALAIEAMADLTALGIPEADISLIESEADARLPAGVSSDMAQSPARTGATLGFGIGLGLGALIGVGAVSLPLLDPLASAGWLPPTVLGAVIGALLGAGVGKVSRMGVSDQQSHDFAAGLQRGQHLLLVRADDGLMAQAELVLARQRQPAPLAAAESEPAPYDVMTSVERTVGPGGEVQVRYMREQQSP